MEKHAESSDDDQEEDKNNENDEDSEDEGTSQDPVKARIRHQMPTKRIKKFEMNCTVGRIEDGNAILLSAEHNILEVPLMLLPKEIRPGNILKFKVERNLEMEQRREKEIL